MSSSKNNLISKSFFAIWLSIFVLKLIFFSFLPAVDDEAYYWVWGKNLSLSYFDHPGMVGWFTSLSSNSFYFRWPFIAINQISVLVLSQTAVTYFRISSKNLIYLLLIFNLIPVTGLGACLALPDALLILFWILSLHFALRLTTDPADARAAILLGISLGLGFCSKYHIVLAAAALLLFSFFNFRDVFKQKKTVFLILIFGFLSSLPVLIWNFQNEWVSFLFQMNRGLNPEGFDLFRGLEYFGGQMLIVSPILLYTGFNNKIESRHQLLLKYFFLVPFCFFLLNSFNTTVEANWGAVSFISLVVLACLSSERKCFYSTAYFCCSYFFIALVFFFKPSLIPEKAMEPFQIRKVALETISENALYGSTYQIASQLWFVRNKPVYKPKGVSRYDMYDLWEQPDLPRRLSMVYKTSSGFPLLNKFHVIENTNVNYGLYSLVEMEKN